MEFNPMKLFEKLIDWLAAAPLLILLALFNVAVVMRYWLHQPLQWTEEISGLLMIWIIMLGSVAAERDNQHLAIPMLVEILPEKIREVINSIISILSGLFLLYVSYAGYKLSVAAQFKVTDVLRISYYWIDIAVPVGFVIIALYMFTGAFKSLRAAFAGGKA
ncbi:tripartite ATP-independent periplasmic transporter, DctQ family [Ochrobactrum quorumnocens]|jgi:TRAP-type C4-dicarboxylate transport system permease small subunit|uniref:TRAP transporter small permease protein n=2 Tax=Ochrobactrum quorumnocens TaxID=271865 RepID=A0A248UA74_9HYPH|nr:tripartite ATP-independent periplasmic transporter, DctQ family [[Ochrobactrum] quorumnocens]